MEAVSGNKDLPEDDFAIVDMLKELTNTQVPKPLMAIKDKKVRFEDVVKSENMAGYVLNVLGVE